MLRPGDPCPTVLSGLPDCVLWLAIEWAAKQVKVTNLVCLSDTMLDILKVRGGYPFTFFAFAETSCLSIDQTLAQK